MAQLATLPEVEFVSPMFINLKTGTHMFLTGEVVVKLKQGVKIEELLERYASLGIEVKEKLWGTEDEYVFKFQDLKAVNLLEAANAILESGLVEWAEPNFAQEYQKQMGSLWHLDNQENPQADVDASQAWEITQGSPRIVIAVIDDGVELNHPGLVDNIFVNAGEVLNGADDDGNGFVDDLWGWDFRDNDNNPNPSLSDDNHGTAVAGVAAARGDNARGICPFCCILPVRIGFGYALNTTAANAIRYAARFADVLNNSWGGGSPSSVIHSAIRDAVTLGRGGKGSVVVFAAGNSASGYQPQSVPSLPAGTHRFRWVYSKNLFFSSGEDTAWLGWVWFPGERVESFEAGAWQWRTGGDALWTVVNDPAYADEGACFTHALKAGPITHGQSSWVEIVKTIQFGELEYFAWVSSERDFDGLQLFIDLNNDGTYDRFGPFQSGVPSVTFGVGYPAAFPEAIAVGASSDFNCRSHYSQFGQELEVVAPSGGGPLNRKIYTTDRTGSAGYALGDYTSTFGGTSSAAPLVSGIAGLVLSLNPDLTQAQVRQILRDTADKIGPSPYVLGRNDRYGFGKVNAYRAVAAVVNSSSLKFSDSVQKLYIAYYQRPADPGGLRFWAQRLDTSGGSLEGIIDAFATSPEAVGLYDTNSDGTIDGSDDLGALIDAIYQALFNRTPDAAGKQFYLNALQSGQFPDGRPATPGRVALDILNGAQGSDQVAIANKLQVANVFTQTLDPDNDGVPPYQATYNGDADAAQARAFLAQVTSDPATVKTQSQVTEFIQNQIANPGDPILKI